VQRRRRRFLNLFLFFYALALPLSYTCTNTIKTQNPTQPMPLHDVKPRELCPASGSPLGTLPSTGGRVGWPHSPCVMMGQE